METEFKHVPFDVIRYSMVWEGAETLVKGLEPKAGDHLLVITSGGCNVLNMLLEENSTVTAVDINPLQNNLLHLKGHIIHHHSYETYSAILGFEGKSAVKRAGAAVINSLPAKEKEFWKNILDQFPEGLLLAGKLEMYITSFYRELSKKQQDLMHRLFECEELKDQYQIFEELKQTDFKEKFVAYFDSTQLSKGRDPRLFKYTKDPGGLSFYSRLEDFLRTHLLSRSFISRFFFYGPAHMPMALRPACYREENYKRLADCWSKLRTHTGEAIDYLCSPEAERINKASLSNIFEYTSPEIFEATVGELLSLREHPLKFMYWNLLNDQGGPLKKLPTYQNVISERLTEEEDCFYFDSVNLFDTE
ncbi:MAG TPA: DUF3419 family protein [Cryomorphaceae bacterium]|nr:DUF3419 family protein [Cryomorphaceae bacterium]